MRITGGLHRGRPLKAPEGLSTRPTSDRARLSIFNILLHAAFGNLEDALILDVFAGTGAMGLEALSQGGAHAVFMEQNLAAMRACRENISTLKEESRTHLITCDALLPPPRPAQIKPRTLVFLDPPYGKNLGVAALAALDKKGWLDPDALIVLEMSKKAPEPIGEDFSVIDERTYGIARIVFLKRG